MLSFPSYQTAFPIHMERSSSKGVRRQTLHWCGWVCLCFVADFCTRGCDEAVRDLALRITGVSLPSLASAWDSTEALEDWNLFGKKVGAVALLHSARFTLQMSWQRLVVFCYSLPHKLNNTEATARGSELLMDFVRGAIGVSIITKSYHNTLDVHENLMNSAIFKIAIKTLSTDIYIHHFTNRSKWTALHQIQAH